MTVTGRTRGRLTEDPVITLSRSFGLSVGDTITLSGSVGMWIVASIENDGCTLHLRRPRLRERAWLFVRHTARRVREWWEGVRYWT